MATTVPDYKGWKISTPVWSETRNVYLATATSPDGKHEVQGAGEYSVVALRNVRQAVNVAAAAGQGGTEETS